jgi:hypothetical protein
MPIIISMEDKIRDGIFRDAKTIICLACLNIGYPIKFSNKRKPFLKKKNSVFVFLKNF